MDKLENHIKDKLNQRELSPSPQAWERIEAELGEEKKQRGAINWVGIAAAMVVLLMLSVFFLNKNETFGVTDENSIVNDEIEQQESIKYEPQKEKIEVVVTTDDNKMEVETKGIEAQELVVDEPTTKVNPVQFEKNTEVTAVELDKTDNQEISDSFELVSDELIANKLDEVLAMVNAMENDSILITDTEIDSLLLKAQQEILEDQFFYNATEVDAMALLTEVELELYDERQHPLFNTLKESFFILRTAVADRNK